MGLIAAKAVCGRPGGRAVTIGWPLDNPIETAARRLTEPGPSWPVVGFRSNDWNVPGCPEIPACLDVDIYTPYAVSQIVARPLHRTAEPGYRLLPSLRGSGSAKERPAQTAPGNHRDRRIGCLRLPGISLQLVHEDDIRHYNRPISLSIKGAYGQVAQHWMWRTFGIRRGSWSFHLGSLALDTTRRCRGNETPSPSPTLHFKRCT